MSRNVWIWWDKLPGEHLHGLEIPDYILKSRDQPVGMKKDAPTPDEVWRAINDYINGFTCDVTRGANAAWTYITFPTSFKKYGELHQRSIEVHRGLDCVCVVTREMDAITNAIAMGLGRFIALRHRGRYEDT